MLKVLELFAGVGGFRVGLEKADSNFFHTKWSNQWEPSRKVQHAFDCYKYHFPDSININKDISTISNEDFYKIDADMIVGGFPCQDYSVARSLNGEMGIEGKKGVLFWEIVRAVKIIQPQYIILENVDRLLKSPSSQRGRDFAIMLSAFNNLDYSIEWRVINAADYGMSQRRRRVFFFIYKNTSEIFERVHKDSFDKIIYHNGLFAKQFPVELFPNKNRVKTFEISSDISYVSDKFSDNFYNSGIMRKGVITTIDTIPIYKNPVTLKQILQSECEVNPKYYMDEKMIEKFKYLRGPKKIERVNSDGHIYIYSEGGMSEIDELDKPSRTMLTSEGTVNRSSHVVKVYEKYRFLTPLECERLNGFSDNWTSQMPDRMRYFCMGNALVTDIVSKIGIGIKDFVLNKNDVNFNNHNYIAFTV